MNWREKFLVIAHRGASSYEPENTLSAFRKALDMRADAIEFDVRRSKDGEPVVIHDEDLKRVSNIDKKIFELTVVELKNIKVFYKETIPTLDEVLTEFGNIVPLFIEIKDEGIEDKIIEYIKKHQVYDNTLIISFNYNILSKIKKNLSKIDIGLLTYKRPLPIDSAIKLKAFAILPRYNLLTPNVVKELHSKNIKIYTWTINDISIALKIVNYNIDGIATDNPLLKNSIHRYRLI